MNIGMRALLVAAAVVVAAATAVGGGATKLGREQTAAAGLFLRIEPSGEPWSLNLPTEQTYFATPTKHWSFRVVAWRLPSGNLPKDDYIRLEVLEDGKWVLNSGGGTNPTVSSLYGCPAQTSTVQPHGFDWTWRATYWHHTIHDELLATSNTVRTTCVYQAGTFRSGTYDAVTKSSASGGTFRGRWVVTVAAGRITGLSHWTCCPGPRTDPLTGSANGDRVVIVRRFAGQGAPPGSQTYSGRVIAPGRVTGTISGSFIGAGATFSLTLRR